MLNISAHTGTGYYVLIGNYKTLIPDLTTYLAFSLVTWNGIATVFNIFCEDDGDIYFVFPNGATIDAGYILLKFIYI